MFVIQRNSKYGESSLKMFGLQMLKMKFGVLDHRELFAQLSCKDNLSRIRVGKFDYNRSLLKSFRQTQKKWRFKFDFESLPIFGSTGSVALILLYSVVQKAICNIRERQIVQ